MISKSNIIVSAWDQKKMIGFGRATTDQIYRATLWDVVVDKNYQRLGIGKRIINLIINDKNKKIHYNLQNSRKFDFNQLKMMKNKEYVKKIIV